LLSSGVGAGRACRSRAARRVGSSPAFSGCRSKSLTRPLRGVVALRVDADAAARMAHGRQRDLDLGSVGGAHRGGDREENVCRLRRDRPLRGLCDWAAARFDGLWLALSRRCTTAPRDRPNDERAKEASRVEASGRAYAVSLMDANSGSHRRCLSRRIRTQVAHMNAGIRRESTSDNRETLACAAIR